MSVSTTSKQINMSYAIILNSYSMSASKLIDGLLRIAVLIPLLTVWLQPMEIHHLP